LEFIKESCSPVLRRSRDALPDAVESATLSERALTKMDVSELQSLWAHPEARPVRFCRLAWA
jgi:hypothetical protein